MKLQSTPKPVRFRISSGRQEHSSLESLLSCFDYNELKDLNMSKLIQWLERQGSKGYEIANQLNSYEDMPSFAETIKIFYGSDFEKVFSNWCETKSKNLQFIDIDLVKSDVKLIAVAYQYKDICFPQFANVQWLEIINSQKKGKSVLSRIKKELEKNIVKEIEEKKLQTRFAVKFQIIKPNSNYDEISKITKITKSNLKQLYRYGSLSQRIILSGYDKEKLNPLVYIFESEEIEENEPRKVKIKFLSEERIDSNKGKIEEITDDDIIWHPQVGYWSHIILLLNKEIEQLKPLVDEIMVDGKRIK